ncbi:ermin [Dendropsophus ebraccatus]|uniref:ermin n=1 Tax=Dendropsophus ebraccatus TaxID=150705 RepID=UPI0038319B43
MSIMAEEEAQVPECNGNEKPEIISVTDVIDENGSSIKCDTSQCDSVLVTGSPDILLEDKTITPALDVKDKNEEEQKNITIVETIPDVLDNHKKELEDSTEEGSQTKLETDGDATPPPSPEDISKQDEDQDGDKTETPDILLYQHSHHPSETGTEDNLTETEEENTSIETDTEYPDYGDGSYDEQENGSQQPLAVSPSGRPLDPNEIAGSRPDISRHSYSRYDTVSYRKIRKGNTKQRIDEFESMMNL